MKKGERVLAIRHLEKAVALMPTNTLRKQMLEQLRAGQ